MATRWRGTAFLRTIPSSKGSSTGWARPKASNTSSDDLWVLLEDVQVDAKQRLLIWPDAEGLTIDQSVQRIQKQHPSFPREPVEDFLLFGLETGYDPEDYSQEQLDELDKLTN
jgi:hypothetical protein